MWLLAVISLVSVANAALNRDSVRVGDCVCTNANSVNARQTAGLNGRVAQSLTSGSCGKFKGGVQTADGYTWYQFEYAGKIVWVAGNYLDLKDGSFCSSNGGACSASAKSLACSLLGNSRLTLARAHASGKQDNAFAYNNLRDTCNGLAASRSNYPCSECKTGKAAPGGTVCLSTKLLNYLTTLVSKGSVYVNELAGACHSCTSKHYDGVAVDLRLSSRSQEYMDTCKSMGGTFYDESKTNHIHCEFNS